MDAHHRRTERNGSKIRIHPHLRISGNEKYMNEKVHHLIGQALELLQNGKPAEAEKTLSKS